MIQLILLSLYILSSTFSESKNVPYFSPQGAVSVAHDGRLAIVIKGDIWIVELNKKIDLSNPILPNFAKWTQLTNDNFWDQDPVWKADGKHLIFSSNRSGNLDLWEINIKRGIKSLQQITNSATSDREPTIGKDGTIIWVRGKGVDANLWIKKPGEKEKELTSTLGSEANPAIDPNGKSVLYIAERKGQKQLRLLPLDKKKDKLLLKEGNPEHPSWSPDGKRITYSTRGNQTGIWITDVNISYKNLISKKRAIASWFHNQSTNQPTNQSTNQPTNQSTNQPTNQQYLILTEIPRQDPAYNGDPQSNQTRHIEEKRFAAQKISFLPVPLPPEETGTPLNLTESGFSKEKALHRFDQIVSYLYNRYKIEQSPFQKEWTELINRQRLLAQKATNETALEKAIYQLIKERPSFKEEKKGKLGISSAHPLATAAGLEILKQGGNVVDASIAISFALGVVEPDASGIGGYGEMLIYLKGMEAPTCIEFLTRVPEEASLTNGQLNPLPRSGPVLVNVPGTVAGMELAWKRYGSQRIKWAELIKPAIKLAREGFVIDEAFSTTLEREKEKYLQYESNKKLFFPKGKALQPGDSLKNMDLAWTLNAIARGGADAFYKTWIARRMVEDLRSKGSVITLNDMARYYAVERKPVQTTYRGYTIYSGPPPVSGGVLLTGKLNLLEQVAQPRAYQEDVQMLHSMIEAWKLAPSTNGRIADPGLWPVDHTPFINKALAQKRWSSCFKPDQSVMPSDNQCLDSRIAAAWGAENVLDIQTSTGTTAFAVADGEGNMVSVTQTLGTWGGNFYVTPGLGFLYNDKLRSYNSNPKRYNARIPFARNVTSISPTMVFKGIDAEQQPLVALGAAGNAWITSAVYQIVSGIIDQKLGPQEAIEQPRFLVGLRRNPKNRKVIQEIVVQVEDGFAPGVLQQLQQLGHDIQVISARGELRMGYASVVMVEERSVRAGADPRRSGEAGVVE